MVNLPAFNVTSQMGKSADPFGIGSFDAADGRPTSRGQQAAIDQERKALEELQVSLICTGFPDEKVASLWKHGSGKRKDKSTILNYFKEESSAKELIQKL